MTCEGYPTQADALRFKENSDAETEFMESASDTFQTPEGQTKTTVTGFDTRVAEAVANAGGIDLGDYESSPLITQYNQYVVFDRSGTPTQWKAKPTTPLDYQIDFATYPNPALDNNLQSFDQNSLQALSGLNEPSDLDKSYHRAATVAQIENGDFATGSRLTVTDRGGALFNVVSGGTADGYLYLDAGAGNTAIFNHTTGSVSPISAGATGSSDDGPVQAVYDYANLHKIPVEWDDGNYDISTDITGSDTVSHTGGVPKFTNYTIKEVFPNSLFSELNDPKRLWPNRTNILTPKVVITGDSLSYNHQDFDAVARQNAEDCWPGMNSWSFALRDSIIRNDSNFVHSDEFPYLISDGVVSLGQNGSSQFVNPFNGRLNVFRATAQTDSIKLYYKHSGIQNKAYLWFLMNPNDTGCSFEIKVNGAQQVAVWNTGGTLATDPYQGYELHFVEVPNVPNVGIWSTIELTDFIGTAAAPHATNRDVYFMGASTALSVINQTGSGGQSSRWVVDNLADKVTNFAPDLFIMTIGANDPWAGNPQGLQTVQQYEANLNAIYDGVEAANPNARSILISPPLTSESVVPNATMQRYINKAREVAYIRGVSFIDAQELWDKVPSTVYRFDSIHYTKSGNSVLLNRVAEILGLPINKYLNTEFSYGAYPVSRPRPPIERVFSSYDGASFSRSGLIQDPSIDVISGITKENDYTIRVSMNINSDLYANVTVKQFDANGLQQITASPQNFFNGYILFQLRKEDGSQLVAADWVTYLSSLKFIVEVN